MTDNLSGLELRKQVALKLGWGVEQDEDSYGNDFYELYDPDGNAIAKSGLCPDVYDFGRYQEQEQAMWHSCPAFESSLGALQEAGLVTKALRFNQTYGYGLDFHVGSAEELAWNICRMFLKYDDCVWHEI